MTRVVLEGGADDALVFPPYLSPHCDETLFDYYAAIVAVAGQGLDLIIYQRGGRELPTETLCRLAASTTSSG
ncbi:dihydrodipicolinate synthase family protein [Ornithinimicrobium murale]|uniref:dihydrodipicolinate synthase family protein n=1 Tax=Ornithinimicrobium murale TaxID=1050153 RepID=UPI000E0D3B13